LTAAITGFPSDSISESAAWPRREEASPWSGLITASSLMSAPAMNAFSPEPVRITAPTGRVVAERRERGVDFAHRLLVQAVQGASAVSR